MNGPTLRFMGNVSRKGELQYSNNDGTPFIVFGVACNTRRGTDEETIFFDVTVWRHTAEYAHQNVEVGTGVSVDGTFRIRPYTRNDGQPGVSYAVSAFDFEIVTRGAPAAHFWAKNRPPYQPDQATQRQAQPAAAATPATGPAPAQSAQAPAAAAPAQPAPPADHNTDDNQDDEPPESLNDFDEESEYYPQFMDEG